jgi:two-component system sensor histidine kinase/response regulator
LQEDNPINQRLGCRVLQKLNYETSLAKDGREAVEMVLSTLPDVVLMDLSMVRLTCVLACPVSIMYSPS